MENSETVGKVLANSEIKSSKMGDHIRDSIVHSNCTSDSIIVVIGMVIKIVTASKMIMIVEMVAPMMMPSSLHQHYFLLVCLYERKISHAQPYDIKNQKLCVNEHDKNYW